MFDEFDEIAKKRKMVGQSFPLKYNYLVQLIQQQNVSIPSHLFTTNTTQEYPIFQKSEIFEIMEKIQISPDSYEKCLELLHDMGTILYFPTDLKLRDIVVVKPQFLSDVMVPVTGGKTYHL